MDLSVFTCSKFLGKGAGGRATLLSDNLGNSIVVKTYTGKRSSRLDRVFANETKMMRIVSGLPHFPRLLHSNPDKYEIYMTYCGEKINRINAPTNWRNQLVEILNLLKKKGIYHNSSAINNTCVMDGIIYFIDFAHSGDYRPEKRNLTPELIYKAKDIYDAYDSTKIRPTTAQMLERCNSITRRRFAKKSQLKRQVLIKLEKDYLAKKK